MIYISHRGYINGVDKKLENPKINIFYLINLFLCKLNYFYIRFIYRKYNKIKLSEK